jgi:hypothetical protein
MSQVESRSSGSRFLENLTYLVPSYLGYKERGTRREEDSRLRARVLQGLSEIRSQVANLMGDLAESWSVEHLSDLERRMQRLDALADTIRYAPYGFSGFFDAATVREESLEWILEADLLIFGDLDRMEHLLSTADDLRGTAGFQRFRDAFDQSTRWLEEHLVLRDKALGDV